MEIEFELTIKDEFENFVCIAIPFSEDKLNDISKAVGGIDDQISDYYKKMRSKLNSVESVDM